MINYYDQVMPQTDLATLPPKHCTLLQRYRHPIEQDIPYIESAYCLSKPLGFVQQALEGRRTLSQVIAAAQ